MGSGGARAVALRRRRRGASTPLLTNPYHVDGVALDLDRALAMSREERQAQHAALLAAATRVTSTSWAEGFLAALEADARSPRADG